MSCKELLAARYLIKHTHTTRTHTTPHARTHARAHTHTHTHTHTHAHGGGVAGGGGYMGARVGEEGMGAELKNHRLHRA